MTANPDADPVIQGVRLELYRDNLEGALAMLNAAQDGRPNSLYVTEAERIRSWLRHLHSPQAYADAYERYYSARKARLTLKNLQRDLRILMGRKTRKTLARTALHPEFRLLEREVLAPNARRVLDIGCGEGRMALTLGARNPGVHVTGIDVSATNVSLAKRLNRFPNVAFHQGLGEDLASQVAASSFDLAYSFAVLEHVRDVDEFILSVLKALRPGGRFCFVVPMNELIAIGPVPEFNPPDGVAGHVRAFSETGLRERFGQYEAFTLEKVPGRWRPDKYPPSLAPKEFGAFFGGFSNPS